MKHLLTVCLLIVGMTGWAQGDVPTAEQLAQTIKAVHSLQSNFTEEKHLALLSEPLLSSGTLSFDKQAQQLNWVYLAPFQKGFLIEKERVYRLQSGEKTPVQDTMGRLLAEQLMVWLTLDFDALKRAYEMDLQYPTISFTPRAKGHKVVKRIEVLLEEKNPQLVKQVKMEQPNGDFILWKFSDTQLQTAPAVKGRP